MKSFEFVAANGVPFKVVALAPGDAYGRKGSGLVADKPLVEFYDMRFKHDPEYGGQFVTRYYASTLAEIQYGVGLDLHGGVQAWKLSAADVQTVQARLAAADGTAADHLDFVVVNKRTRVAVALFALPGDAVRFIESRARAPGARLEYEIVNADGSAVSPQLAAQAFQASVAVPMGWVWELYQVENGVVVNCGFASISPPPAGPSETFKGFAVRVTPVWKP